MAQTQSQHLPPSQSFSPPASNPSPGAPSPVGGVAPPPKRQRLSPPPQPHSPNPSPGFGTPQPPQSGSPVNGTSVNGMAHALASAPPGSMGPPSRPPDKEKPTDTAELTDVLASSGIDVREEEAELTRSYANASGQQPQQLHLNTSFSQSTPGTISPVVSFNEPSQHGQPRSQNLFYRSDTPSQPAPQYKPVEAAPENEKPRDILASYREQYHLQSSFLLTKLVERRLQSRGADLGVRIPAEGAFNAVPGQAQPVEVTGPDGSSVVRSGNTLLNTDAPLSDIISLISLSCEERLRTVVDHSASLAYNRQKHSHGVVPPEWKDLAVDSPVSSETLKDGSAGAAAAKTVPAKRSNSMADDSHDQSSGAKSTSTPPFAQKARKFMEKDSSYEEGRAAKRARRSANAILGSDSVRSGSVGPATSGASTPAGAGSEKAPDVEKKMNKKEMKKQAEAKATEAVQHQHAVETARMATNSLTSGIRFGGKKKNYSWLKKPAIGGSGFSTPSRINTNVGNATPDSGGSGGAGSASRRSAVSASAARGLGDWREDGEKGAGIQIRDVLFMLELDGRGVKNVQRGYSKDRKEDRE